MTAQWSLRGRQPLLRLQTPQHGWAQETLARALTLRAVEDGDARALDAAVEAGRRSLEGDAVRQREAATRHTALGIALKARYDLVGSDQDLADSIVHIRAAQAVQLRSDEDRAAVALNYALSYLADFARYGRLSDLDAAIEKLAAAASLPEPASRRHLVALSRAFRLRHEALGRLEDVDAAVRVAGGRQRRRASLTRRSLRCCRQLLRRGLGPSGNPATSTRRSPSRRRQPALPPRAAREARPSWR